MKLGYEVNGDALAIIEQCNEWYANEVIEDFHKRKNLNGVEQTLSRMNFAKRCCADDANLCEIVSVAPEKESASQEFIDSVLNDNRFDVQYRKQLEKTAAAGTVGAYIYLQNADYMKRSDGTIEVRNGKIRINYCDADCIVPLTVENDLVTECAFSATHQKAGKEKTTLVIFTLNDSGNYEASTIVFNELGEKVEEECRSIQLGNVKPFSIMTNAEVNNLKNMSGYGIPKVYGAIPLFKAVDLCYNVLFSDLSKAEKIVLINEFLCEIRDKNGKPTLTPQQKEVFVMLGEHLPDQKTLIQEYNPQIRVEDITKAFELVLSLLSIQFGYGSKKYTFENGQIKTATEYIGTKQDAMQELNRQRKNATDYITDLVHAAMWFSNQFLGTSYNADEPLSIEFDDSYVEDKQTKLEAMRADAISFSEVTILKVWYLMEKYNIPEDEAKKYIQNAEEPVDDLED